MSSARDRENPRRRPGPPGRRLARSIALSALVLGALGIGDAAIRAPVARADDSPTVLSATIYGVNGSVSQAGVTLGELLADPTGCPTYTGPDTLTENAPGGRQAQASITSNDGGTDQGSWPLASALGCLQAGGVPTPVVASDVEAVVVIGADGSAESSPDSTLSGAGDFGAPSDFTDPSEVPVISAQDSASTLIQYDRPARGASDVDFSDEVSGSAPIAVDVYTGQDPLTVTIDPLPSTTVTAGSELEFSAQVTGALTPLSYAWSFTGGAPGSSTASPTVRFTAPGVYDVELQVSDQDGDVGQAPPLQVTVTATGPLTTPTASTPQATTTKPSGAGPSPTGPLRGSGHSTTTTHSATTTPSTTTTTPTPAIQTATTTSPAPTTTPTATTPAPTAARSVTPAAPRRLPATARIPRPRRRRRPSPPAVTRATSGRRVIGRLISAPRMVSPGADAGAGIARTHAVSGQPAALRASSAASPLAVVAGILIGLLLLGLGVTRELLGPVLERLARRGRGGRPGPRDL